MPGILGGGEGGEDAVCPPPQAGPRATFAEHSRRNLLLSLRPALAKVFAPTPIPLPCGSTFWDLFWSPDRVFRSCLQRQNVLVGRSREALGLHSYQSEL